MTPNIKRLDELCDRLVPADGRAATVAGEIVRATSRIVNYSYYNGDHIGVGRGNETCNTAARYLYQTCCSDTLEKTEVQKNIDDIWGIKGDEYNERLNTLVDNILGYLDEHPELETTENTDDMWYHMDPQLDRDYSDEEDGKVELTDDDLDFNNEGQSL